MATAHQLAVITSSCVKPPSNPKRGVVYNESARKEGGFMSPWHGRDADFHDEVTEASRSQLSKSVNFDTTNMTNTMMETMNKVNADLSQLSDDEFYKHLVDLKSEHKKTLQLCEKLYHEKLNERDQRTGSGQVIARPIPVASVDQDYALSTSQAVLEDTYALNRSIEHIKDTMPISTRDAVKDMSASKPPTGRHKPISSFPPRSGSLKGHVYTSPDKHSTDYWKVASVTSSDAEISDDEIDRLVLRSSRQKGQSPSDIKANALLHIEDMWKDFTVDDYAPKQRPRSASLSRLSSSSPSVKKRTDWKNKITVPKPFEMTLREANKPKKKTKAMEAVDRAREERERQEEEECQKKFKATPVPAHVYMPLYDEVMEGQEERRRFIRKHCSELVQSMIQPFKFQIREEEKKKNNRNKKVSTDVVENSKKPPLKFSANPYPERLFDTGIDEKLKEEEEYRRIRIQMRSEQLLHSASLPGTMEERYNEHGRSRQRSNIERAKKAGICIEHSFTPHVNDTVPDFEELHNQFLRQVSEAKEQKYGTVCKPFRLHTSKGSPKHKIYEDIMKDEETLRENRWPFKNPRKSNLSRSMIGSLSSLDSLPTKMTAASELRKSSTRKKIEDLVSREVWESEAEKIKKKKVPTATLR